MMEPGTKLPGRLLASAFTKNTVWSGSERWKMNLRFRIVMIKFKAVSTTYTMKRISIFSSFFFFSATLALSQNYPHTPPAVSPMPMKPEMTEIWEPEVPVVTPGKNVGDAPSDANILFDGKHLDQWASQKDPAKPAPWRIVANDHME